jgi:hypothetical protein
LVSKLNQAEAAASVRIHLALSPKLSLAHHQNAIPFLSELFVVNETDHELTNLVLAVASTPPFLASKIWPIDAIAPGARVQIRDRDIGVDTGHLAKLTEAERIRIAFTLTCAEKELAQNTAEIELLPRNHWSGVGHVPELVAAFVQPNDPAVDRLLHRASEILQAGGREASFDGYTGGRKRVWEVASAFWGAISGLGLVYGLPASSFEQTGQKVRSPSQILEGGIATCLDTAVLFAACLEQAGLHPLVIFTQGHAFVGVWLKKGEITTPVVDDISALRKRVKLKEIVVFETTLAAQKPSAPRFSYAADKALSALGEAEEDKFELVVDIKRCRLQRIRPLASAEAPSPAAVEEPTRPLQIPDIETPADLPDEAENEPDALDTPEGRIERWQRKLLDLSLRNNLLNFKVGKKAIPLQAPDPSRLEDFLADGKKLSILGRPEIMEGADHRDEAIHEARHREDARKALALEALERSQVYGNLAEADLDARLVELFRSGRAALQEGGANTVFLAFGFLSWTKDSKADRRFRAPLILIPVTLERKSVRTGFKLSLHEDEPRFNPTLIEMLRKDFKLTLPALEGELHKDASGLDVTAIWQAVQLAVKDIAGWEVIEDVVLANFSFAKHLMWKDLVERTDQLKQNAVVKHLIDTPRETYQSIIGFPDARTLDRDYAPETTFCPLPADSSQLSAVMAAANGKDFVLIGPPGTGKSQTIANVVAQCLAEGKTVLLVSEKIVALDVVYRRLRDVKLGDFCLELHSNRAKKTEVLEQFRAAWDAKGEIDAETWRQEAARLKSLRNELNEYVDRLHRRRRNGMTVYQAMGNVIAGGRWPEIGLSWPNPDVHGPEQLAAMRELVEQLDLNLSEVGSVTGHVLAPVVHTTWSPIWQQNLVAEARSAIDVVNATEAAVAAYLTALGIGSPPLTASIRQAMQELALLLPRAYGRDWRFVTRADAALIVKRLAEGLERVNEHQRLRSSISQPWPSEIVRELKEGCDLIVRHREIKRNLSAGYSETDFASIDMPRLLEEWQAAEKKMWPFSGMAKKKVHRALTQASKGPAMIPDEIGPELERLTELRRIETAIAGLKGIAARSDVPWKWLDTDEVAVGEAIAFQGVLDAAARSETWTDEGFGSIDAGACGEVARSDLSSIRRMRSIETRIAAMRDLEASTGGLWAGLQTRSEEVAAALEFWKDISAITPRLGTDADGIVEWNRVISRLLGEANALLAPTGAVDAAGRGWIVALRQYDKMLAEFAGRAGHPADQAEKVGAVPSEVGISAHGIIRSAPRLSAWCAWRKARQDAISMGLLPLVEALEEGAVVPGQVLNLFTVAYCRWWLNAVVENDEVLRSFGSPVHEKRIEAFRALDQMFTQLTRDYIRADLCGALPDLDDTRGSSEWGLLKHEMGKKKRHMPLRELIKAMPNALTQLTPCLLMSPLSVAQYLSPDKAQFDVVVFDEASQIPVWDAIGAIARGKQVVMVGDPNQLPPTSFFDRVEDDDADSDVDGDLESILDECLGANLPTLDLSWHYRSKHESLIAFSNQRYYKGGLVTFPSPVADDKAVKFNVVQDGVYEKGGARINKPEARVLVADLVALLKSPAYIEQKPSVGVVTFNAEQQKLIEDLLDDERRKSPALEVHFSDECLEPIFVKNLENVQGDERDVMFFSLAYGPAHVGGPVSMNFGPMNRAGGHRRLNVAITRARYELRIFASFTPDRIDLSRTNAEGVRDLKHFLEFAERGPRALAEANAGSIGGYESPFEEAVATALQQRGWVLHPQVGVSAFRVDLGVVDPDFPGRYLAGVECDGATYHRSATARDRDKLREQVLRGLGWEIVRTWSTDWWIDQATALNRLDGKLKQILDGVRARRRVEEARATALAVNHEDVEPDVEKADVDGGESAQFTQVLTSPANSPSGPTDDVDDGAERNGGEVQQQPEKVYAKRLTEGMPAPGTLVEVYLEADLIEVSVNPARFFEGSYDGVLSRMVKIVVEAEGPIRDDVLCRRIARHHGWQRTGGRIVDRVMSLAKKIYTPVKDLDHQIFFWPSSSTPGTWARFRRPDGEGRPMDEICLPELRALAREILGATHSEPDPIVAMARTAGLGRKRAASRERLEKAFLLEQQAKCVTARAGRRSEAGLYRPEASWPRHVAP